MSYLVDVRAVGPPRPAKPRRVARDQAMRDRGAQADRPANSTRMLVNHSPYRKTHRDLSYVRVIAASAIVAGLLLSTAPLAFAQVGQLLAAVPAAFAQVDQIPGDLSASVDSPRDIAQTDSIVQHRLDNHTTTSIISWDGTTQALRCSYGLLFEGNTRSCVAP